MIASRLAGRSGIVIDWLIKWLIDLIGELIDMNNSAYMIHIIRNEY